MPEQAIVRLEVQVENLTKEVHRLNNIIMGEKNPYDAKISSLDKATNGRLDKIEETLSKLADKIETQAKFPWNVVIPFTSLLLLVGMSFGGFFYAGIKSDMARMDRDIITINAQVVPRAEHEARWKIYTDVDGNLAKRLEILEGKINSRLFR